MRYVILRCLLIKVNKPIFCEPLALVLLFLLPRYFVLIHHWKCQTQILLRISIEHVLLLSQFLPQLFFLELVEIKPLSCIDMHLLLRREVDRSWLLTINHLFLTSLGSPTTCTSLYSSLRNPPSLYLLFPSSTYHMLNS